MSDERGSPARSVGAPARGRLASAWAFVGEATRTFREGGFRGTLRRYGWKLFAGFVAFYLVRDVTLYILLPYLAAKGLLSFWQ